MAKLYEIDLELIDGLERTRAEMMVHLRNLLKNEHINFLSIRLSEKKVKDW